MRHKRVMVRRDENFLYDGGGRNDFLFDYNGIDLGHTSVWWVLGWKTADLCVSSNQAKEIPICDSYSQRAEFKQQGFHGKSQLLDRGDGALLFGLHHDQLWLLELSSHD